MSILVRTPLGPAAQLKLAATCLPYVGLRLGAACGWQRGKRWAESLDARRDVWIVRGAVAQQMKSSPAVLSLADAATRLHVQLAAQTARLEFQRRYEAAKDTMLATIASGVAHHVNGAIGSIYPNLDYLIERRIRLLELDAGQIADLQAEAMEILGEARGTKPRISGALAQLAVLLKKGPQDLGAKIHAILELADYPGLKDSSLTTKKVTTDFTPAPLPIGNCDSLELSVALYLIKRGIALVLPAGQDLRVATHLVEAATDNKPLAASATFTYPSATMIEDYDLVERLVGRNNGKVDIFVVEPTSSSSAAATPPTSGPTTIIKISFPLDGSR